MGKQVLLFGNSITDYFPSDLLEKSEYKIEKRGYPGATLPELKLHVKQDVLEKGYNLDVVLVQGGLNDYLSPFYRGAQVVSTQIVAIGKQIQDALPQTKVCIESLTPVHTKKGPGEIPLWSEGKSNLEIQKINQQIKVKCANENLSFVNLFDSLVDREGQLSLDDTIDGVHLLENAYEKILRQIEIVVKKMQ